MTENLTIEKPVLKKKYQQISVTLNDDTPNDFDQYTSAFLNKDVDTAKEIMIEIQ